jgi:hypothetical protein
LFRSWERFGVAGEWPNLRLVLRLAYLRVYILNSLPYLELQRNIIAPEAFLENVPWHEDHHLTLITLKYLDCIRRCPIRAMARNSPDGFFFTINAHFSFKILFGLSWEET